MYYIILHNIWKYKMCTINWPNWSYVYFGTEIVNYGKWEEKKYIY